MTIAEFRELDFQKPVVVKYFGSEHRVTGVNFGENLMCINTHELNEGEDYWLRPENAELISN